MEKWGEEDRRKWTMGGVIRWEGVREARMRDGGEEDELWSFVL